MIEQPTPETQQSRYRARIGTRTPSRWVVDAELSQSLEQRLLAAQSENQRLREERDTWHERANQAESIRSERGAQITIIERDALASQVATLKDQLHEIDLATEGNVDGAPDASSQSKLCNAIQNVIHPQP